MNESATYLEWAPPSQWADVVVCRWHQAASSERVQRVLPDNCADVIVDDAGHAVAVGVMDEPTLTPLPPGTHLRGLRLRPEAIASVLGVPGSSLRNTTVPLDDVIGSRRARALTALVVDGAGTLGATPDRRVRVAVDLLGHGTVDDVANRLNLSTRQLRRVLLDDVGIGPKTLQRVARLHRFLAVAEGGQGLAVAAAEAGYADQPHLTREVRALSGLSPAALLAERAAS